MSSGPQTDWGKKAVDDISVLTRNIEALSDQLARHVEASGAAMRAVSNNVDELKAFKEEASEHVGLIAVVRRYGKLILGALGASALGSASLVIGGVLWVNWNISSLSTTANAHTTSLASQGTDVKELAKELKEVTKLAAKLDANAEHSNKALDKLTGLPASQGAVPPLVQTARIVLSKKMIGIPEKDRVGLMVPLDHPIEKKLVEKTSVAVTQWLAGRPGTVEPNPTTQIEAKLSENGSHVMVSFYTKEIGLVERQIEGSIITMTLTTLESRLP